MIPLSGRQCILNFGNVVPRCLDGAQNLGYAAAVKLFFGMSRPVAEHTR
jgi:hypothetical protein